MSTKQATTKQKMVSKNCNECEFSTRLRLYDRGTQTDYCIMCNKHLAPRYVGEIHRDDGFIQQPIWCPIKENEIMAHTLKQKRTAYEVLRDAPSLIKWEDIKVNCVYHVPPIYTNNERKDILVISKTTDSLQYRILSKDTNSVSNVTQVLYKQAISAKYMSEHKRITVEAKTK